METKANYVLIGAFTLAGFLGILLFLMWFAKLQLNRQFAWYDIYFPEVAGLSVASNVTFSGLSVGKVIEMGLSDRDDGRVWVRVEVREDTPVRTDSTASLVPQGVTGVNNVAITAGSPRQPLLREVATGVPEIRARGSVLQALSDEGPQMIERLNTVTQQLTTLLGDENQSRVRNILDNVERSSGNLDKAMSDISAATAAIGKAAGGISDFGDKIKGLGDAAQVTLGNADAALTQLTATTRKADALIESGTRTLETVGGYVAADLTTLTGQLSDAMPQTARTLASAERAFDDAAGALETDFGPALNDLRSTLATLNEAVAKGLCRYSGHHREAPQRRGLRRSGLHQPARHAGGRAGPGAELHPRWPAAADPRGGRSADPDREYQPVRLRPAPQPGAGHLRAARARIPPVRSPMRLVALPLLLSLAGCSALGALNQPKRDVFELLPASDAPVACRAGATELVVELPKARSTLDTDRIMIRPSALQAQYLPDAQWGDTVPVTLQTLLVRSFARYPAFGHVGRTPLAGAGDYALLSEIEDFNAVRTETGARVVLSVTAQLVHEGDARVAARGRFQAVRELGSTATPDLIAGFDAAQRELVGQITAWGLGAMRVPCR